MFGSTLSCVSRLRFPSFFFDSRATAFKRQCTVHALFVHCLLLFVHCSSKNILKIGPTALFTHLKIILLQHFQFSISAKISCIQIENWSSKSNILYFILLTKLELLNKYSLFLKFMKNAACFLKEILMNLLLLKNSVICILVWFKLPLNHSSERVLMLMFLCV